MTATLNASDSTRWYQWSAAEQILATTVVAAIVSLSLVGRDIGSGLTIIVYGFPFPLVTDHPVSGRSVSEVALLVNVGSWILAVAGLIIAWRRINTAFPPKRKADAR